MYQNIQNKTFLICSTENILNNEHTIKFYIV